LDRKHVTILLLTDQKGVGRRFVIPVGWFRLGVFAASLLAVLIVAVAVDYSGLLLQSVENKKLRGENAQLRSQFEVLEERVEGLEASLERVRAFTAKLKVITDTDDEDRALTLAMGPIDSYDENFEETEDRGPASVFLKEDALFLDKPVLDAESGELAIETQRGYNSLLIRVERNLKESALREQGTLELLELLSSRQSLLRSTPSIAPLRGWLNSEFGYRKHPVTGRAVLHQGIDIRAPMGSPVRVTADGVISFAGYDGGYGKLVSVDHGYGVVTRYGHNSQLFVIPGQKVSRGDVISAVGATGRTTGPHLHYEVRLNGVAVDPKNYILSE